MVIIKQPHAYAVKYLKKKQPERTDYRLCRYVLKYKAEGSAVCSLYNLVTGEVIGLNREEIQFLESLPCSYKPWMDELIGGYYLVPSDFDEMDWVDCLRAIMNNLMEQENDTPCYVIMPTTSCNARCWYCFEEGIDCMSMDERTAERVAQYIFSTCQNRHVRISWYGGEPTLKPDIIDHICRRLEELGVKWDSLILTNAYLCDEKLIENAKTLWHLTRAIVSLDGNEAVYNRTKAYKLPVKCSESPYYRVLNNIETLLKNNIFVQLRLNMGPDNSEALASFLKETAPRFTDFENQRLNVAVLSGTGEPFAYFEDPALADKRVELLTLADSLGFNISDALTPMRIHGCLANRDNQVIIDPAGGLSKCYAKIPDPAMGNIWDYNPKIPKSTETKTQLPGCASCVLYPDCYRSSICRISCTEQLRNMRKKQMLQQLKKITHSQCE